MTRKTNGRAREFVPRASLAINARIIPFSSVSGARARLATEIKHAKLRKWYIASSDPDHVDIFQRVNDSHPVLTLAIRILVP